MDDQSLVWMTSLDSWEAMIVIAVIALISSVIRERPDSRGKSNDPKVFNLLEYGQTHRRNQRVQGRFKPKV